MGSLWRGWVAESGSRGGNGNAGSGRWRVAGGPAAEVGEQVGDSQGQVQWQPRSRLGAAKGQVWGRGS